MVDVSRIMRSRGRTAFPGADPWEYGFDYTQIPERERFDAWIDTIGDTFSAKRVHEDGRPFQQHARLGQIGGFGVVDADSGDYELRLATGKDRKSDPETIVLRVDRAGATQGLSNGADFKTSPGDVLIHDMRLPYEFRTTGLSYTQVYFPYSKLGFDPARHSLESVLTRGSPFAEMLAASTRSLLGAIGTVSGANQEILAQGYLGLVRALMLRDLSGPIERQAFDQARRERIMTFIKDRLADPDLSVAQICAACNVSRATLYRSFAKKGGIQTYIRECRLARAREELERHPGTRGIVSWVAERWGFTDLATFNRAFRQAYGSAPSQMVGRLTGNV